MELIQYAIMSKDRKYIAIGSTHNHKMASIKDLALGIIKQKVILFGSLSKAIANCEGSFSEDKNFCSLKLYNTTNNKKEWNIIEPVKVTLTFENGNN